MSREEILKIINELNALLVEATSVNDQHKITAQLIKYNGMLKNAKA